MSKYQIENAIRNGGLTENQLQQYAPSMFAETAYHAMSERFRHYRTIEVVRALKHEGWIPFHATQNRARKEDKNGFQTHMIQLVHRDQRELTKVGDTYFTIWLRNAADGTSAYKLYPSILELRCTNGMTCYRPANQFGEESAIEPISIRHTGRTLDDVIDASYRVVENIPLIAETIDEMKANTLTESERIEFARMALELRWQSDVETDADGNVIKVTSTAPITPERLLETHRTADRQDQQTLYRTTNIVQEHLVRGGDAGFNRNGGRTTTREINSVSENIKVNRALWVLAEMKRLKQI